MNYFSRLYGALMGNATEQRTGSQAASPSTSAHEDAPIVGVDSALQVSTVWACVALLVETIASLPMDVYRVDKDGKRTVDKTSRAYQVLHTSPTQEFWEQMMLNYVLRGNAFARIDRAPNGEAISLWPMSADQVDVLVAADGKLVYVYRFDNESLVYDERDILHIRGMGNGVIGLSPLDYMRSSIGLAISAQNHTTKTFKKDARRPGVLMTEGTLTDEQRKTAKKELGGLVSGNGNELYVLEAQFKFLPLGMSPADIQLLETRQFSVQDLARWFGVPSVLINDNAESTSLGSSVQQIVAGFYRLKLRPLFVRVEDAVAFKVFTPSQRAAGLVAEFDREELLRMDPKDRMEISAKGVQNGLRTRNEQREKDGLAPLPGGDTLTAQVNLMPVELLGTQKITSGSVPSETVEQ
jgi:HK97 family phage portal protein